MPELPERSRPSHNELHEIKGRSNIVFLTIAAKERRSVFDREEFHCAIRNIWNNSTHWLVGSYVIMPDHIHLFCTPGIYPPASLRKWTKFWKRQATQSNVIPANTWQTDCWDTQMRTGNHYTETWHYVQNNPVRAGLVEDGNQWPYRGELNVLDWRGS